MQSSIKTIVITGAGRGIGRALAIGYAKQSPCHLILCARTIEGLQETARQCEAHGATTHISACDIRDENAIDQWVGEIRNNTSPDIVILNAGVSACLMDEDGIEKASGMRTEMETNFLPAIRLVDGLIPVMKNKKGGARIVLISSIAALLPLPGWAGYCASKTALLYYGHAMRPLLKAHGIETTIVLPGFVKTDLSDKLAGKKTLMTTPDKMAARIIRAVYQGKKEFIHPRVLGMFAKLGWLLPPFMRDPILMYGFRFPMKDHDA